MRYLASCSFGKDSLATILLARKHGEPLDEEAEEGILRKLRRDIAGRG